MFEVTRANDISILHLYGEISLMEMDMVEKTLNSLRKHQHLKVLIDMAGVDHLHFEVTKRLAREAQRMRDENGELKIANTNPSNRELFRFTGADQFMEDYSSVADALLSFLNAAGDDDDHERMKNAGRVDERPVHLRRRFKDDMI